MQREPTVPIGIWGPALLAGVVLVVCWGGRSIEPASSVSVSSSIQADSSAPAGNGETPAVVEPQPHVETRSETESPPAITPLPETGPPRGETTAPSVPATPSEPEIDPDHDVLLADAVPPASSSDFPAGWTPLGGEEARRRGSGVTLAPLVVIVSEDRPDLARALAAFAARLRERVLEPARLAFPNPSDAVVELDFSGSEKLRGTIGRSDPGDPIDALGEAWLAQLFEERGRRRPPAWWCEGAIEAARGESLLDVLRAPAATAPLARVFARGAPRDDEVRASAGSFAALCLSLPPGDHLHATWLEFAGPSLAPSPDEGDEIAARFGFTRLAELEARWEAARGR